MEPSGPTIQIVHSMVLDYLRQHDHGQEAEACEFVAAAILKRGLFPGSQPTSSGRAMHSFSQREQQLIADLVNQSLWRLVVQFVLVPGMNSSNRDWPFFRLTASGKERIQKGQAQAEPYDPDRFLELFDAEVPGADHVVRVYFAEAVRAFNSDCPLSAAITMGAASEKAILLLADAFGGAIKDPQKRQDFEKEQRAAKFISPKYEALKKALNLFVAARKPKLPDPLPDCVRSEIPAAFELIRRLRNDAGHPSDPGLVDGDLVFINLRVFVPYAKNVFKLIKFLGENQIDW